jgi:hypothetical protein
MILMRRYHRVLIGLTLAILGIRILTSVCFSQGGYVSPTEAHKYIGKVKTVCGKVTSATFAARTKGQPTFLNLDQPYPNQVFTIVIWGSDRKKFSNAPEVLFRDKVICVTGKIKAYRGKPEIIVDDPSQIVIKTD